MVQELAISGVTGRMAVVVEPQGLQNQFLAYCPPRKNLEAVKVGVVTEEAKTGIKVARQKKLWISREPFSTQTARNRRLAYCGDGL